KAVNPEHPEGFWSWALPAEEERSDAGRRLIADYDADADVLYLSLGPPVPSDSEDDQRGVVLRWSLQSGEPTGATVVGYRGYSSPQRVSDLLAIIDRHLRVPEKEARLVIEEATKRRRFIR